MNEARFYEKDGTKVKCKLCPHMCVLSRQQVGICKARQNMGGKLISLVYGKPVAVNVDPVEKKPLYHFHPGTTTFSIGTAGCNLGCEHCQNWDIAAASPEKVPFKQMAPEEVIEQALAKGCNSISYTYNEPTIFFEYACDCARLAKKKGLANILVTNGYINKEPAGEFLKIMDAANVDLKAFTDDFYKKVCKASLTPVLEALRIYRKRMWLEVTNLVIAGKNDDLAKIEKMAEWIAKNLGKDVPLHFSRAFPMYIMQHIEPTPIRTLLEAQKTARKHLDYVYIGNTELDSDTHCPKCGKIVIKRTRYSAKGNNKCECGFEVAGVF